MPNDEIKQLVKSSGWLEVLTLFQEEFENFKKNIKTEDRTAESIALELMSKQEASRMVKRVVDKITRIGNAVEIKKESYK